jgi:hypothetical protein
LEVAGLNLSAGERSTRASIEFAPGSQAAVQQRIPALGYDLPIEYFVAALKSGTPKFRPVFGIAEQHAHRICEAFDIFWINQQAGVSQYFRYSASSRSDDWSRASHRFDIHQTKWLLKD